MQIGEHLKNKDFKIDERANELYEMTVRIKEEIGFQGRYGQGYWFKKLKQSGIRSGALEGLLKQARGMDDKYNKGGWLTNKLK